MKNTIAYLVIALGLVACENPADKTADAKVAAAATAATASGQKYLFTEGTEVSFVGSKVTGSHDGGFKTVSGHFSIDEGAAAPNAGQIVIDTTSIWSDDDKLTEHLKNSDFFDVAKYPTSTFTVTGVKKTGEATYDISGNLELVGTTKNITFPATGTKDGEAISVKAEFDIKRKDFGMVYAGRADDLIRDEVVIRFDLVAKPE